MTEDVDLDALGAQFREAKASIGVHRQRQAQAEVAFARAFKRWQTSAADEMPLYVVEAQAAVDQTVADVEWCKAVVIATGEAIKGEPLEVVLGRNDANRVTAKASHQRTVVEHVGAVFHEGR